MTPELEGASVDVSALGKLNDQLWRRLGITQTFDRLLVEAVAQQSASPETIRMAAGRTLSGGAARFYELTFPQLLRDLVRRNVLAESHGSLHLDAGFADKVRRLIGDQSTGASHVAPTPGVTLEDVLHQAEVRQQREKIAKSHQKREAKASGAKPKSKAAAKSNTAPRRREKIDPDAEAAAALAEGQRAAAHEAANPTRAPAASLFNTKRLNRLLDVLDTGSMNRDQLFARLELGGPDLDRFLSVCEAVGLTRPNGGVIELHWQGLELARTAQADRRMAVIDIVKTLRDKAAELDA